MTIGIIGGEVLRIDNGQGIAVTFLDIGVILFVIGSVIIGLIQRKTINFFQQKYLWWFVGIGVISLVLNIIQLTYYQFVVSLLYALRFLFYTVGVALGVQLLDKKLKSYLPYFLFGTSTFLALLGFVQYAFYPALRNLYYLGWDEHLYRIFSTFLDPNFMGLFFVCGLLLGIHLFANTRDVKQKIIIGICVLFITVALFLTYSRGSYIAAIVGIGIALWRMGQRKIILGVMALIFVGIIVLQLFSPHSEGTKLLRTASVNARLFSVKEVTTIIAHHPFLGVGFDAYRYAQQKEGFLTKNGDTTHSGAGTDNSFLFVFATTGIVGLIAYIVMTYNILKFSFASKTIIDRTIFASYIALIIGSFFVNALFYPFLLVWLWVLVGCSKLV